MKTEKRIGSDRRYGSTRHSSCVFFLGINDGSLCKWRVSNGFGKHDSERRYCFLHIFFQPEGLLLFKFRESWMAGIRLSYHYRRGKTSGIGMDTSQSDIFPVLVIQGRFRGRLKPV